MTQRRSPVLAVNKEDGVPGGLRDPQNFTELSRHSFLCLSACSNLSSRLSIQTRTILHDHITTLVEI
jgi:hypothetical protein